MILSPLILIIITAVLLLPGLVGIVLPILPGIPYMFLVALAYGLVTKFNFLTTAELGYLAVLTAIAILVDYFSGILGAKFGGASGKSLLVGMAGFIVGMFLFPPFGGFVGMFFGIVGGEIYFFGKTKTAIKSASGGVLGTLAGMIINLVLAVTFMGLFLVFSL